MASMHVALAIDWLTRELKALVIGTNLEEMENTAMELSGKYIWEIFDEKIDEDATGIYTEWTDYENSVYLMELHEQTSAVLL